MTSSIQNDSRLTDALDMVRLRGSMARSSGSAHLAIGLIDGPVEINHPHMARESIRELPGALSASCAGAGAACQHGTFVAGIYCAKRDSPAPAICPGCTLLVRPIFAEGIAAPTGMPSARPEQLAEAIVDCLRSGARVINLSAAMERPSSGSERSLEHALSEALRRGAIVVAAAGNQGVLGSTAITRHPWVIPVAAYDAAGTADGAVQLREFDREVGASALRVSRSRASAPGASC